MIRCVHVMCILCGADERACEHVCSHGSCASMSCAYAHTCQLQLVCFSHACMTVCAVHFVHSCARMCVHISTHACIVNPLLTYRHTHVHAYIHTHTHTYITSMQISMDSGDKGENMDSANTVCCVYVYMPLKSEKLKTT